MCYKCLHSPDSHFYPNMAQSSSFFNVVIFFLICCVSSFDQEKYWTKAKSIHMFSASFINGTAVNMSTFANNCLLIVNVASRSGFTSWNYRQLQQLYKKFESEGFIVAAFPCNQFANQEPGTNQDIQKFAIKKGVTFPMFSKIDVNGKNAHPVYKFLTSSFKINNRTEKLIAWSFEKILVNRTGQVVGRYAPRIWPKDLTKDVKKCLKLK